MVRYALVLLPVLCGACSASPEPTGDPQTTASSGSGDPTKPSDGKGKPVVGDTGKGDPAVGDPGKGDPGNTDPPGSSNDCQALWDVIDDLGCDIAKAVCAVLEAIPVGGALVKCDIAVPLACGLASAAAEAAEALCPK